MNSSYYNVFISDLEAANSQASNNPALKIGLAATDLPKFITVKDKTSRTNTLNPKYILEVHHVFYMDHYSHSVIVYTNSRIKDLKTAPKSIHLNLLDYKSSHKLAKNEIRDLIFNSIYMSDFNLIIDTPYKLFSKHNNRAERQIRITKTIIDEAGLAIRNNNQTSIVDLNNTKDKAEYRQAKSNIPIDQFPLINILEYSIAEELATTAEYKLDNRSIHLSELNKILTDEIKLNLRWKQEITRGCKFHHGIDTINTKSFDSNSYFIFINDDVISSWLKTINSTGNLTKLLFRYSIALLYISDIEFSTDNIIIAALQLLQKYLIIGKIDNADWLPNINLTKVINKLIQCSREENIKDTLDNIKSDKNGCLFPSDWTLEEKREWKKNNGIERNNGEKQKERTDKGGKHEMSDKNRKERSDKGKKRDKEVKRKRGMKYSEENKLQLKIKAMELREQGMKIKDIADVIDKSQKTINRWFKETDNTKRYENMVGQFE